MKTGLSKREKIMLFVLGMIALVALSIQFVIIPLANSYSDAVEERERLRGEKALHELEVANLPALRNQNSQAHGRFESITSGYPELVPNELIDSRWLTPLSSKYSMNIMSLRFARRDPPRLTTVIETDSEGNTVETTVPAQVFTKINASMNVTGNYYSLLNLINEMHTTEFMRLTSVNYSRSFINEIIEHSTISLSFEITLKN